MYQMKFRLLVGGALLLAGLLAAYSNHFQNAFHFDDFHTITDNPSVRDVANIPKFFTDARLSSVRPANQSYRPLTSASLALDYRLGRGYVPFYFHLSTFVWFAVLLGFVFLLFHKAMEAADPHPTNGWTALLATGLYGLHPAMAETVNYIIQRADLYSTLGVVAGVVVWAWRPSWRTKGIYLLPPLLGVLAKAPALVFPLMLAAWALLVESEDRKWMKQVALAFVVFIGATLLTRLVTPPSFNPGASSPYLYWVTQPWVALHYFKTFFLPTGLTADTDMRPLTGLFSDEAIAGIALVCALAYAAVRAARKPRTGPIAFGIVWFLLALAPTSLLPLAEVENDHRMFFPFVGLTLAVVWPVRLLVLENARRRWAAVAAALVVLVAFASATYARNAVWRTEETLWADVASKSPRNGRGLMNYGLTLMARGDYQGALNLFERAEVYTPNYSLLEINHGIALGGLHRAADAERHFQRAIALDPDDAASYFYYARWLRERGRLEESAAGLTTAIAKNPMAFDARYMLMEEYATQGRRESLRTLAMETLKLAPGDETAERYLKLAPPVSGAPATPEAYIELSLDHYRAGRYRECVAAAKEALRLRPDYAEAYNNIAAAEAASAKWDDAIAAAREAIRLKPDFQLAKNNLAWALGEKQKEAAVRR